MDATQKPFSESGSSPPRHLMLRHLQITPGRTVALGEDFDERGRAVSFEGDWRSMSDLSKALHAGETVEVALAGRRS
jgi:hypothetical protein